MAEVGNNAQMCVGACERVCVRYECASVCGCVGVGVRGSVGETVYIMLETCDRGTGTTVCGCGSAGARTQDPRLVTQD